MPAQSLFDDPGHWRGRAEEARAIADAMKDPQSKATMQEIALGYEQMAERADMRKSVKH